MTIHTLSILLVVLLMWVGAWNLPPLKARQALLLFASYLFYSSWGIGFLSILIASSLLNFALGSLIRRHLRVGYLWLGIAVNVLLLGVFKYLPPLLDSGWAVSWEPEFLRHIVMPVGMSFWTFQGLSYLFDVYLEEEVDPSVLEFCLYMAFWPTVVSGPVCRLPTMLPQFRREPTFTWDGISVGARRLIQGLFMKYVLAEILGSGWWPGTGVAAGFDRIEGDWGGIDVWLLGIGFGFQLFFDFAGYSLMAIGVARVFGIQVAENFDRPFLSTTIANFWARWHMSLSFWIRDYVYKPLAATRRNRWWPYVAIVISMTLFGLWHGGKWTFILFGVYHGLLLVMHRVGQQAKRRFSIRLPRYWGVFLAWGTTFLVVSLGFILFRANDLTEAFSMFRSVVSPAAYGHFAMPRAFYILTFAIAIGYFVFTAGYSLVGSWRAHYRKEMSKRTETAEGLWLMNVRSITAVIGGLFEFFAQRLWWWFAPALFILAVFMSLVIYTERAVITVRPFIYTLF